MAEAGDVGAGRLLAELRARGAAGLDRVRLKDNRTRLLSASRDRRTLNAHRCFAAAPADVLDDVATFLRAPPGSAAYREAVGRLQRWEPAVAALRDARVREAARVAAEVGVTLPGAPGAAGADGAGGPGLPGGRGPRCAAPRDRREALARRYRELNRERFGGGLPDVLPLRFSARMRRRLGHARCETTAGGERFIAEIALNVDLLLPGNEAQLDETLLHEMAHAEAWLRHGHHGHGRPWKRVARRVGCEPRACTRAGVRRTMRRR